MRKLSSMVLEIDRHGLFISIHLSDRVTQSDQIATRRFSSSTGRVLGKFCLIQL
jgi:hypothetical protein